MTVAPDLPIGGMDRVGHALLRGFCRRDVAEVASLLVIGLLPVTWTVGRRNLYRRDLVFRTIGGQSESSIVMTLACVSRWWKVV
jgi:hypothetical protein